MISEHTRPRLRILTLALISALVPIACGPDDEHTEDEHDHSAEAEGLAAQDEEPEDLDAHAGEDPDAHAGEEPDAHAGEEADDPEAHAEEGIVLTPLQRERIGLRLRPAGPVTLVLARSFPGEVVLVPDRVMHVVPQAPGIVRETIKTIGDRVAVGDTLAWIESSELAEAKLAFFSAAAEIGCCELELPRAQEIYASVGALLEVLDAGGGSEAIAALEGREMGEWRGKLLGAQAEYEATHAALQREQSLRQRGVSSEKDLIDAGAAFTRAQAGLAVAVDTARYTTLVNVSEESRKRQVAELGLLAAENRLHVLGVEQTWIDQLRSLAPGAAALEPCTCSEPDCIHRAVPSMIEALEDLPDMGRYALIAQQAGVVTEKHLSLGERITGEESAFVIVDTDRVWVRFNVYPKDLGLVGEGAQVQVLVQGSPAGHNAAIDFVSPVVDERTRTVTARIELANPDGDLRPGLFVTVTAADRGGQVAVAVPQEAVQVLEEREVVLIEEGGALVPLSVVTGRSDGIHVEILAGLEAGTPVVVEGAFDLKAMLVTSELGAHAGHGH